MISQWNFVLTKLHQRDLSKYVARTMIYGRGIFKNSIESNIRFWAKGRQPHSPSLSSYSLNAGKFKTFYFLFLSLFIPNHNCIYTACPHILPNIPLTLLLWSTLFPIALYSNLFNYIIIIFSLNQTHNQTTQSIFSQLYLLHLHFL